MNIEIANRLYELRKKHGYSQEELADKLGISRQSVSKWERAEASPDTDNLICLAKLYNVSIDDILRSDETIEDIVKETKERTDAKKIEVETEDDRTIIIDKDGVINLGPSDVRRRKVYKFFNSQIVDLLVICFYLIAGFSGKQLGFGIWSWHPTWIIFLLLPIYHEIVKSIYKRKLCTDFAINCLAAFAYLFIGFRYGIWHPSWVVFFVIPIYYALRSIFKKEKHISVSDDISFKNGIHVVDKEKNEKVDIDISGIHVEDEKEIVHVGLGGIRITPKKDKKDSEED